MTRVDEKHVTLAEPGEQADGQILNGLGDQLEAHCRKKILKLAEGTIGMGLDTDDGWLDSGFVAFMVNALAAKKLETPAPTSMTFWGFRLRSIACKTRDSASP